MPGSNFYPWLWKVVRRLKWNNGGIKKKGLSEFLPHAAWFVCVCLHSCKYAILRTWIGFLHFPSKSGLMLRAFVKKVGFGEDWGEAEQWNEKRTVVLHSTDTSVRVFVCARASSVSCPDLHSRWRKYWTKTRWSATGAISRGGWTVPQIWNCVVPLTSGGSLHRHTASHCAAAFSFCIMRKCFLKRGSWSNVKFAQR